MKKKVIQPPEDQRVSVASTTISDPNFHSLQDLWWRSLANWNFKISKVHVSFLTSLDIFFFKIYKTI